MSKEATFLIYCIEIYKNAKNLSGKQVMSLFNKYHVPEYVVSYFEALHGEVIILLRTQKIVFGFFKSDFGICNI